MSTFPLIHRGKHDPLPWALKTDCGKAVTNSDVKALQSTFKVGDRVIEVKWMGDGWEHIDYGKIPTGNGLLATGTYTFGKTITMQVQDGVITALAKDSSDTTNLHTPLQ